MFSRVRGGVYTLKILKSADFGHFQNQGVRPTPYNFCLTWLGNFFKVFNMSSNSRGTKKNQINMMQCDHGGQGTKKTSKKAPGNGIFWDFDHPQPYIYIYIYIYIILYILYYYLYTIYKNKQFISKVSHIVINWLMRKTKKIVSKYIVKKFRFS